MGHDLLDERRRAVLGVAAGGRPRPARWARAIHRIHAEAYDRTAAVHRLLERLAFRCEGCLVEAGCFKGESCTLRIYAIRRREAVLAGKGISA